MADIASPSGSVPAIAGVTTPPSGPPLPPVAGAAGPQSVSLATGSEQPPAPKKQKRWSPEIEQESKPALFDKLLKIPLTNDDWVCWLVPVDHFEPSDSEWVKIKYFPGIHKVGKTNDGRFYEIAVLELYRACLVSWGFGLKYDVQFKPRVESRLDLRNAVRGLTSGLGRGLDRYYRRRALGNCRIALEWTIVTRDILDSDPEVLCRFLLRCLFLALHLLEDFESAPALRLINRNMWTWTEHFRELKRRRIEHFQELERRRIEHFRELQRRRTERFQELERRQTKHLRELQMRWTDSSHEISLLRGLLESVGGEKDNEQRQRNLHWSANDSFAAFRGLLGLEISHTRPVSFGSFDKEKMTDALRQSTMSEGQLDVLPGQELLQHIPIGVSEAERGILPAELVHDIGSGKVHEIRGQISLIYRQVPSLRGCKIQTLVLVCYRASSSPNDRTLREWLDSEQGNDVRLQVLEILRESSIPELKVLAVTTLLWCSRVQAASSADSTDSPSTDAPSTEPQFLGCRAHFWDFRRLLRGLPITNPQLALETMAVSVEKVFGKNCHPAVLHFLEDAIVRKPQAWSAWLSDRYWCYSLHHQLKHSAAWDKTAESVDPPGGCGCHFLSWATETWGTVTRAPQSADWHATVLLEL